MGRKTEKSDGPGVAIWASVSAEVDAEIRQQIQAGVFPVRLKAEAWNSGKINWLIDVIAGFCAETAGRRPLVGGHGFGAEILLRAVAGGRLAPARMVLMPNRLHRRDKFMAKRTTWRAVCRMAALPGLDRVLSHGAKVVFTVKNVTDRPHGFSIDEFGVQRVVEPGRPVTVRFTANRKGTFRIYCQLHPAHGTAELIVPQ